MSRTLNLRGTFTEGESRNLNGRILRNTSNPNPPPRVVTANDFDRYINILKANNRFPIPKEQTLSISTTPYTLDKDIYLAKDSVISFFGTSPAYLNKFSLSTGSSTVYDISAKFQYTASGTTIVTQNTEQDYSLIYIEYLSNFYRVTYIVHRVSGPVTLTVPANSYYYSINSDYNAEEIPTLTFYEGDQTILLLSAPSTPTIDGDARIVTSSLITQFVFTSN
ncbi:hypothetical protein [Human fecal virus Jorvi2]|uniref:hypothetical protein n=1 Tax=Human fecal virus Jorvi2 TaxID=2017081 RepID=UPI000B5BDF7F|nr:hypothetical protein [Human fecal virus Jorvi2]ASH99036.1 hypothetical protein [Human fecal virus Jorvi2]